MNKSISLFFYILGSLSLTLFGSQYTIKPDEVGTYVGIQAFTKKSAVKSSIAYPEKLLHFPMKFDDRLATDGLLIFLDNSETALDSLAEELLFALNQKSCPILASTSLLKTIETIPTVSEFAQTFDTPMAEKIRQYFNILQTSIPHFINENPELTQEKTVENINTYLQDKAQILDFKYKNTSLQDLTSNIIPSLKKELTPWNHKEWIIKTVDNDQQLLLLVPRDYIFKNKTIKLPQNPGDPLSTPALTELEYQIGLKIDHMETINDYQSTIKKGSLSVEADSYFMNTLWKPIQTITEKPQSAVTLRESDAHCSDIFVSRAEYNQALSLYEQPRWAMYIKGHGEIDTTICGLSIPLFSQFLNFLGTKINNAFLAYNTCYAVGTNQKLIYKDLELPTKLSFPIATAAVFDDMVTSSVDIPWNQVWSGNIDFKNKNLKTKYYVDFKKFINQATSQSPDIASLASTVMPTSFKISTLAPHIRLGGSPWFTIDTADHKIATIGTPFAQTCTHIDLAKKFAKKGTFPYWYCLYSPLIPCELIISPSDYKPFFFPMAPLKMPNQYAFTYYIKKISAPHRSLKDIYDMFTIAISDDYNLIVAIDKLKVKQIDNRIIHAEPQTISNVFIIHNKPTQNIILFTSKESSRIPHSPQLAEKFYVLDLDNPILEKKEIDDYRHLKKYLGFTDAIAQFEKEKKAPIEKLEAILKKKIKKDSETSQKFIP